MRHDFGAGHSAKSEAVDGSARTGEQVVYRFPKNSREEVRATLSTFRGYRLADFRIWRLDDEDVDRPTRKGLALRLEQVSELVRAAEAVIEAEEAA